MLSTYVQEVLDLELVRVSGYPDGIYVVSLSPCRQILGQYLDYSTVASIKIYPHPSLISHPTIRQYAFELLTASVIRDSERKVKEAYEITLLSAFLCIPLIKKMKGILSDHLTVCVSHQFVKAEVVE
jgi:hypothetical protein